VTADREHPCVVRLEGIAKRYGTVDAVRDLNLSVRKGEIYGFLGPNGAGKTTTILMLLGIERPTAGRIEVFARPGPLDPFEVKRRIGVVSEAQYLYDDMSAWEYLMFFARLYRVERAEARAQALLERLNLWEFRRLRARDHSRGMQQKLGLTRALLHRPELLVLDEPVSGLDPHGIRQVRELLVEQNRQGATIFISSHILSEVERTAHRVGILHGGRLVAEDEVGRLGARMRPESVVELTVEQLGPTLVEALRREPYVAAVEVGGAPPGAARLRVTLRGGADHRRALSALVAAQGGLITQMTEKRLSLEEAFVRLTTENVESLLPAARGAAR
jgi:ABC-2 type transport system ATP-binding protein